MRKITCQVCKAEFPRNDIVTIEGINVCPECKPVFEQKLREGMSLKGEMGSNDALDKRYRSLRGTWFIMLGWPFFCLCMALLRSNKARLMDESTIAMVRIALYAFAGICLIESRYVRKLMVSYAHRQISSQPTSPRSSASKQNSLWEKYNWAVVVPLVMSEFIAISGIFLFIRGRSALDLYLLLLVSVIAMIMNRPKKEELASLREANPTPLSQDVTYGRQGWEMPPELTRRSRVPCLSSRLGGRHGLAWLLSSFM